MESIQFLEIGYDILNLFDLHNNNRVGTQFLHYFYVIFLVAQQKCGIVFSCS